MSDIQTIWNGTSGDYAIAGGSLVSGSDVETAVLLSLFTDRVADIGDVIPDNSDRRGWWGDTDTKYTIGSRLWLLDRAKGPMDTPRRAEDYAREALQWMLDDGVVAKFDISASWVPTSQLNLQVTAYRSDGTIISNTSIKLW